MRKKQLEGKPVNRFWLLLAFAGSLLASLALSQTIFSSSASAHVVTEGIGSTHYNSWRITTTTVTYSCAEFGCVEIDNDEVIAYERDKTCNYFVPYMSDPNEFGCNHTNTTDTVRDGSVYTTTKREFIQDGHRTGAPHKYGPKAHDHETTTTTSTTVAPVGDTTTSTSTTVAQTF